MRCARVLLWILAAVALGAGPARATSVTVLLTGTWTMVTDTAGVTSIDEGDTFTVTLTYDDATPEVDPEPDDDLTLGDYLLPAATSALTLTTGSYTFTLPASEGIGFSVGNSYLGNDDFVIFAENFTSSGLSPFGTGYGYMNPSVYDTTETAHSSDALADLPWDITAYDSSDEMYFLIAVTGAGPGAYLELIGDFTQFSVLPEPSLMTLAVLAASALVLNARGRG